MLELHKPNTTQKQKRKIMKHKKISFYLNITTSKFLAYLIFFVGSTYAFIFKDSNVLIATFAASSAVMAAKSYTASKERIKRYADPYEPDGEKEPDGL